jgi:hypothetical protein
MEVKPDRDEQNCFTEMSKPILNKAGMSTSPFTAVMFRQPRLHLESQFFMCYTAEWGIKVTSGTTMSRSGNYNKDFFSWISHMENLTLLDFGPSVDYKCIDPRNLQTRHMSCVSQKNPTANHALSEAPKLDLALNNLYKANWIGITEFYHESMCLLSLRRQHLMPEGCECNNTKTVQHVHIDHDVKKSNLTYSPTILRQANKLIRLDQILYSVAVERFIKDLTYSDVISKKHIGCREYSEMWNDYTYIHTNSDVNIKI